MERRNKIILATSALSIALVGTGIYTLFGKLPERTPVIEAYQETLRTEQLIREEAARFVPAEAYANAPEEVISARQSSTSIGDSLIESANKYGAMARQLEKDAEVDKYLRTFNSSSTLGYSLFFSGFIGATVSLSLITKPSK
jgi:hypothetical protein